MCPGDSRHQKRSTERRVLVNEEYPEEEFEYDDEKQPINMEGFGQGVSLFVLVWTVSYTLKHSI